MMILHHYPMSPFSEKVRLMYGYTGGEWLSVISPEMPPRPIVDPLTGGYRRIPVGQVGADVFCDTRLICAELATAAGKPELSPTALDEQALATAAKFEGEVFWAAVASIPARKILLKLLRELPLRQAFRFIKDRAGVARRNGVKSPRPVPRKKPALVGVAITVNGPVTLRAPPPPAPPWLWHATHD